MAEDQRNWRVCLEHDQRMQYTPIHGLVVAATKPVGRFVLLSKLEETSAVNSRAYELSTNRIHEQEIELAKRINGGGQDAEDAEPQVIEANLRLARPSATATSVVPRSTLCSLIRPLRSSTEREDIASQPMPSGGCDWLSFGAGDAFTRLK